MVWPPVLEKGIETMENLNTQTQTETPKEGVEYLRELAGQIRLTGTPTGDRTAFDIEAAADKIEQQEQELAELKRDKQAIIDSRREDNDRLADALKAVIGDRVEAIAESAASDAASDAAREEIENLDISAFEYEIGDMIDDRLPDRQDEDEQREAVESIVKEVLSGATLTIDI